MINPTRVEGLNVKGRFYIVTHGEKGNGANPGLTAIGVSQMRQLREYLPKGGDIGMCVCGTGRRHIESARALGLPSVGLGYSPIAGVPDSLENAESPKTIVFADSTEVSWDSYCTIGVKEGALALLNRMSRNAVICSGRPLLLRLGITDAKSAAVYCVEGDTISEVLALGTGNS